MGYLFCLLAAALAGAAAELPVRQVILYKHGVGYFERFGELKSGESARLDFNASEMNDVLKSLTIVEEGGGKVAGVRYDSSDPLSRKLSTIPFRLGDRQPLSAFLDQLKGARLELKFGPETISGAIVGARVVPSSERQPEREQLTLLLDSGELRTLDLSAATGLRLTDPELRLALNDYLANLSQSRSREKRSVYIDSTDASARRIAVRYMAPMPVWKSSYRFLLHEKDEPLLEGWAVVDNTTGEDWTKIQLALVSGRPISFISRLYEPRYIERPTAELPEDRVQAPAVHEGAVGEERAQRAKGVVGGVPGGMPALAVEGVIAGVPAAPPPPAPKMMPSSIATTAETREAGDLFEYRFASPVTVRKGESAMLPFLQQKIAARKLLIYSELGWPHPRNAAEITNSTGNTLDGGPLTVYDAGVYAGEALMETLKAGDRRLVSYAVDLGTRITTQFGSSRDMVREVRLRRGVLTTRSALQETRTYTARNVDQKLKTLIIEHSVRPDYKLLSPKPAETTGSAYRFEVKLPAAASEKLPVVEERVFETSTALVNLTPDVLLTYVQNKAISDTARKQLERVLEQKRRIAATDNELRRGEADANEMARDQERLRQNIASLNRVSGQQEQVQAYARQLAAQEQKLAALRDRAAELRKQKAVLESELNTLIENLEF